MHIMLVSVPRSGTRFFQELIEPQTRTHFFDGTEAHMQRADVVVCAVRDPRSTLQTWWNRESDFKLWDTHWRNFAAHYDKIDFFLPIDHPSRDERLKAFGDHVGRVFTPDWSRKVGTTGQDRGPPPPRDMSMAFGLPIMRELYG